MHTFMFADLLQQQGLPLSGKLCPVCRRLGCCHFEEPVAPHRLDRLRNLVFSFRRHSPVSSRIAKNMDLVKADILKERAGGLKFLFSLSGKTDNDIGGQSRAVIILPQKTDTLRIFGSCIVPVHAAQGLITSALKGEMEMRADLVERSKPGNEAFRHDPGFQGAQADPFKTIDRTQILQQIQESIT